MLVDKTQFVKALKLTELVPCKREKLAIVSAEQARPGLQFSGYFTHFAYERMQIIGLAEMTYLDTLAPDLRQARLREFFSYALPCVVICRSMPCPDDIAALAAEQDIPVYGSPQHTTHFQTAAIIYLNRLLAPRETMHGVLIDVHGVGVLLTGESGVGKSEAALELVKRGHQLAADDVVDICRVNENRLVGEAPEMIRHFMEIRGLGIIDIRTMYGIGSVLPAKSIDIVIHLELWRENKEYDRLGLAEEFITILGVKRPHIVMPVRPGRNLAIIVEVAARNWRLNRMGFNAAAELDKRLTEMLQRAQEPQRTPLSEDD